MSYELHVNAGVSGQQQLENLTRATDTQSASSKKLNEALYGVKGATDYRTGGGRGLGSYARGKVLDAVGHADLGSTQIYAQFTQRERISQLPQIQTWGGKRAA